MKQLKQIEVLNAIHKRLSHVAVEHDINLKDLASAILNRAFEKGLVDLVEQELREDQVVD